MCQAVHTNIAIIAATELGLRSDRVRVMPTSTDKVPNTSATAASCGTDLNGAAVKNACEILRSRLIPVAVEFLKKRNGRLPTPADIQFRDGLGFDQKATRKSLPLNEVLRKAYLEHIRRSAAADY